MSVKTSTAHIYEKVKIWEIYGAVSSADDTLREDIPLTKTPAIDVNFLKKKEAIVWGHRLKPDVVVINYPQSSLNRSTKLADRESDGNPQRVSVLSNYLAQLFH